MSKVSALLIVLMVAQGWTLPVWAEALRDPTRPLNYRVPARTVSLELNSILISDERRLAVINGQSLRENDPIAGVERAHVRRIEAGSVVVQHGDRTLRLHVNNQPIRRPESR